jgi:hypothetical protein
LGGEMSGWEMSGWEMSGLEMSGLGGEMFKSAFAVSVAASVAASGRHLTTGDGGAIVRLRVYPAADVLWGRGVCDRCKSLGQVHACARAHA